jgi:hypothetical protein
MPNKHHPFHPIIFVRGFAATHGEIEEAVADPYMGFNIGSTKARMLWTGDLKRFFFESPLVRLMSDHDYNDVFVEGDDLLTLDQSDEPLDYRCVIIYVGVDFGDLNPEAIVIMGQGDKASILILSDDGKRPKGADHADNSFRGVRLQANAPAGGRQ